MKLVIILLVFVVACYSQHFAIVETYSDSECKPEALVARFYTNDYEICNTAKRSVQSCPKTASGVSFVFDAACFSAGNTNFTFPSGWQIINYTREPSCESTWNVYNVLGVSQANTTVVTAVNSEFVTSNVSLSCDNGVTSFRSCALGANLSSCLEFSAENNKCTADNTNSMLAIQTSCIAPPVVPIAPPINPPVNEPVTEPVTSPLPDEPHPEPIIAAPRPDNNVDPSNVPAKKAPFEVSAAMSLAHRSLAFLALVVILYYSY